MKKTELTGKVQTVLGPIDADSLGVTLPHEHLLSDLSCYFTEPAEASERSMAHEPVRLENRYWVTTLNAISHADNLKLTDEPVAIKEVMMYKMAGGNTVVEVSNIGLARDPLGLARIARATGLNIVMGSGYYIKASHPPELAAKTEGEIADEIVRDILVGVGNTGIKAGIVGEIGCSVLDETEKKVLRASAIAQQRTGAALCIHPSMTDDLLLEIVKILGDAGADLSRTIISHVDAWGFSPTTLRKVADAGCYIAHDTFGFILIAAFGGQYLATPSDMQRINSVIQLIADGYLNNVLMSHDICLKHVLTTYGGYGYAHVLRDILPVMRSKGVSEDQIHTLLVENPKRVLSFALAKE